MLPSLSEIMTKPPPIDVFPFRHANQLSEDGKIIYKGQLIHRTFRLDVEATDRLTVEIVRRTESPEQALHLFGTNCRIKIRRGISARGVVWISLWHEPIEIEFEGVKPGARFTMWNALGETVGGPTNDAWGNFGVIIEEKVPQREWTLRFCQSPNRIPPDFNALVLLVTRTGESGP